MAIFKSRKEKRKVKSAAKKGKGNWQFGGTGKRATAARMKAIGKRLGF